MVEARILRAGFGAAVVALLVGAVFGSYGGWAPVLNLAGTYLGSWIIAIILVSVLAFVYAYWFNEFLPGTPVVRGAIFGILVWILLLILGGVSSFFKAAVYPSPAGSSLFLSLLLHLAWGSTLGLLYEAK